LAARVGLTCAIGEEVLAYFAGEIEIGGGREACLPTRPGCWFPATVDEGPDPYGVYLVSWADGEDSHRAVHASGLKRTLSGELCGSGEEAVRASKKKEWKPPQLDCTLLLQLHWEASEAEWREAAMNTLRVELAPDEVVAGFDWHVIFRYQDPDRCELAYETVASVLRRCTKKEGDAERCYAHPLVRAVEYVGEEPALRRRREAAGGGSETTTPRRSARSEL